MTSAGGKATPMARQVRGSSLLLGGRAFAAGVNLLTQVLLIRYLAATDYGVLAYILSLIWVARNLSTLGLHRVLPRLVPQYHERGDRPRLAGSIALQAATILVVGLGLWLALLATSAAGRPLIADEPGRSLVIILALLVPLEALDYFLFEMLMAAFHRPRAIAIRKHVVGPAIKLMVVVAMIGIGAEIHFLAIGLVVAALAGIAVYLPMVGGLLRELQLWPLWRAGISIPWSALGVAIPLLTTDLVLAGHYTLDAVFVEASHGFAEVASLRAVQPAATINELVAANFGLLFMPLAARLSERDAHAELDEVYWRTASWQTALSVPIFLLTFSLASVATVALVGDQYRSSAPILAVLASGYFFSAAIGPSQLTLVATGRIRYIVAGNVMIAIVNIVLLLLLVPPFGALGAAVATASSFVTLRAYELVGLRGTGVRGMRRDHLLLVLTAAGMGAGLLLIQLTIDPPPLLALATAGAMVLLTYRLHRRALAAEHMFPELRRLPGASIFFGASEPADHDLDKRSASE